MIEQVTEREGIVNILAKKEFIRRIPKTDLHVHLDGSLRVETLIELSKEHSVELPSETVEGLNEIVFKERYEDLVDYLKGFRYTTAVMQTPESLGGLMRYTG